MAKKRTCDSCGREFDAWSKAQRFCSQVCRETFHSSDSPWHIKKRDGFCCVYCGRSSIEDGIKLTIDHVVPDFHGGTNEAQNLVTACKTCNCEKTNQPLPDDVLRRVQEEVRKRNAKCGIPNTKIYHLPHWDYR